MRALVTGCAGFIGSHLTEALLEEGHAVLGVDCFNDNYGRPQKIRNLERSNAWNEFDFVPVDLSRGQLGDLVDACDVVFHLAAEPGVRPSWGSRFDAYLRNNVAATQHLLEALVDQPSCRLVYASSSSIYGETDVLPTHEAATPRPHSPYGVTKLAGEQLCRLYAANHGVHSVSLRYFSVYGPRQRPDMAFEIFCEAILDGRPLEFFGDGGQTRDFTYVGDVVAATRTAADAAVAPGSVFNIGGGSRVRLDEVVDVLEDLAGGPIDVHRGDGRMGDVRDTWADISAAQAQLGYAPQVELSEGIARQWLWAQQRRAGTAMA